MFIVKNIPALVSTGSPSFYHSSLYWFQYLFCFPQGFFLKKDASKSKMFKQQNLRPALFLALWRVFTPRTPMAVLLAQMGSPASPSSFHHRHPAFALVLSTKLPCKPVDTYWGMTSVIRPSFESTADQWVVSAFFFLVSLFLMILKIPVRNISLVFLQISTLFWLMHLINRWMEQWIDRQIYYLCWRKFFFSATSSFIGISVDEKA